VRCPRHQATDQGVGVEDDAEGGVRHSARLP
jgi:hypothetical protein